MRCRRMLCNHHDRLIVDYLPLITRREHHKIASRLGSREHRSLTTGLQQQHLAQAQQVGLVQSKVGVATTLEQRRSADIEDAEYTE